MIVVGRDEYGADVTAVLADKPFQMFHDRPERRIAQFLGGFTVLVPVSQALRRGEQQRVLSNVLAGARPIDAVAQVHADEFARSDPAGDERVGRPFDPVAPFHVPV